MSAVSVLSVPWVLDKMLPGLSKAAQAKGWQVLDGYCSPRGPGE